MLIALSKDFGEELFLRTEVVQQSGGGDSDDFGDLLERGVLIPLAPDHVEGALEDLLASRHALRVRTSSCHASTLILNVV